MDLKTPSSKKHHKKQLYTKPIKYCYTIFLSHNPNFITYICSLIYSHNALWFRVYNWCNLPYLPDNIGQYRWRLYHIWAQKAAKCDVWPRKNDIYNLYWNIIKTFVKYFVSILQNCAWSQLFYLSNFSPYIMKIGNGVQNWRIVY